MSEINVKSPHIKQRDLDYLKLIVKVTFGDAVTEAIDIPGLTVGSVGALGFSIEGLESELGLALDPDRRGGISILGLGTLGAGITAAEASDIHPLSVLVSADPAGSRELDILFGSATVDFTTTNNSLTDAVFELSIPIKAKDF